MNGDSLAGLDLSGIDLSGEVLSDIDMTGTNLSNANLTGTDFSNTNFTDANLSNANFTNANLSNANLTGANLSGAIFIKTSLDGTGFEHLRQERQFDLKRDITHTAYLEAPTTKAHGEATFQETMGGTGKYAMLKINIEPLQNAGSSGGGQVVDAARNVVFVNNVPENVIKAEYMEGVPLGIQAAKGILIGAPLTNVRITAIGGQMHETDSNKEAFTAVTQLALKQAMERAGMRILEPVYNLAIMVTGETTGDVVRAITHNGGRTEGMADNDEHQTIQAALPYRTFGSFEAEVKSVTGEDALFSAQFHGYEEMPHAAMAALIAQHRQ